MVQLLVRAAKIIVYLGATDRRVDLVLLAHCFVSLDPLAEVIEAGRAQISQAVLLSVVHVELPLCLVILVGLLEVKSPYLKVHWEHRLRIKIQKIEAWWLTLVSGGRTNNEVHSDRLSFLDVSHHLVKLRVDVGEHSEPDDMLVPISNRMVPSGILSGALIEVRHVGQNDCVPVELLDFLQLVDQPPKLVARVVERGPSLKVGVVADVGVQRDDPRVVRQLFGVVSVLKPRSGGLCVVHELGPRWRPFFDCLLKAFSSYSDLVLRISVVVAHGCEYAVAFESVSYHLGSVFQDRHARVFVETLEVVRNRVTAPKDGIRFDLVADVIQQALKCPWRNVTIVVAPLSRRVVRRGWQSAARPAANWHLAHTVHARSVVPIHVKIAN